MRDKPFVSVSMITYNHEAFISQAIEGVLIQETDFPVELIIGDDCSTDRTREICLAYQKKFPDKIRVLPREKNLGITGNSTDVFKNCDGKYVALCEGDDFWTHPQKLQKQVDFLEANPDFAMCSHNAIVIYNNKNKASHELTDNKKDVFTFDDVVKKNFSMPTNSCVFRNNIFQSLPDSFPMFDWAVHLLSSSKGKIKFLDEVMSVYRKHEGGWTNLSATLKAKQILDTTKRCKDYFAPANVEDFDRILANTYADVCFGYFKDDDSENFSKSFEDCKKYWHLMSERKRKALAVRSTLLQYPLLAKNYRLLSNKISEIVFMRSKKV